MFLIFLWDFRVLRVKIVLFHYEPTATHYMFSLAWFQGDWKFLRTTHMQQSDSVLSWLTSVVHLPLPLTGDDEGPADPPLLGMGRSIQ